MCKNLVEKGDLDQPLLVYNRSIERSIDLNNKLPSGKIEVVKSISEGIGEADIIFSCLSNDAAVEETIKTALARDIKGKVIVDCSTIHPDTTKTIAESTELLNHTFLPAWD
jgi:3-hydroxyisobutyrate dehydrogenase-like beta-hydroxyacid dehydrogenase